MKEITDNEVIQFVGIRDLDPMEQEVVHRLTTEYYSRIKRQLKNITDLVVHIKCMKKEGDRKKFSMHIRAIAPTGMVEADKASDFDLSRALHKGFEDVMQLIKHKFH